MQVDNLGNEDVLQLRRRQATLAFATIQGGPAGAALYGPDLLFRLGLS